MSGDAAVPLHTSIEFAILNALTDYLHKILRVIVLVAEMARDAGDDWGEFGVSHVRLSYLDEILA